LPFWPERAPKAMFPKRIYFARAGLRLKIGHSYNPQQRVRQLTNTTHQAHRLLGYIEGCDQKHELFLHHALKAESVGGEYFLGLRSEALLAELGFFAAQQRAA